jgi:hypothetical protein
MRVPYPATKHIQPKNEKQKNQSQQKNKNGPHLDTREERQHSSQSIFRRTNIKIAFRTQNTIGNRLLQKQKTDDEYTTSGIYKLTCPICNKAYVGQTEGAF